jgi:hypothetical protein
MVRANLKVGTTDHLLAKRKLKVTCKNCPHPPLTPNQLHTASHPVPTRGAWWNGTAKYAWGGRHLGIAEAPRLPFPKFDGLIAVMNDGWDVFLGSGFGHKCFRNEQASQCYSWRGKEIPKTAFEIAVTADALSSAEQRCLLAAP